MAQGLAAIVAAALAVVSTGCATGPVAPCSEFGSSVCGSRASLVAKDIAGWHNAKHPDCKFIRPLSARILRDEGDAVAEQWIIEACDRSQFTYSAYIMPGRGGFNVAVGDADAFD